MSTVDNWLEAGRARVEVFWGLFSSDTHRPRLLYYYGIFFMLLIAIGFPLGFYIWGSFWSTSPGLGGHFTLEGYRQLSNPAVYKTLENTLIVGFVGTFVALFFGIAGLFFSIKTNVVGARFIALLYIIQYLMPSFITAIAWNFWAGRSGFVNTVFMWAFSLNSPPININSVWGIALVAGAHYAGLVYLLSSGAIRSIPAALEEASRLSGGSELRTFWDITLRLAIPAISISTVLVFARLIQSFGVPVILGLPGNVFVVATHMYYALTALYPPNFAFASALGMIILLITMGGLLIQRRITGSREKYEVIGGEGGDMTTMRYDVKGFKYLGVLFLILVILVYIMPYISLFVSSFQSNYAGLILYEADWTLDNYATLLVGRRRFQFYEALINTLQIAGIGALAGMIISALASYVIIKTDSKISSPLDFLTLSPAAMPGIIVGTAILWIFLTYNPLGLMGSIWLIMLALITRFIVYGVRATNSSLRSIGHEMEDAARVAGGGFISTFKNILMPLIKPGFMAGYVLLFVDFMKVLTIPLLLQGPDSVVMSVLIWQLGVGTSEQLAAAMSTLMILLIGTVYLIADRFTEEEITEI